MTKKISSVVKMGWTTRKSAEMQSNGLEQERGNHENKSEQPDAATERAGQQAEPRGGVLLGVFDAHALKDACQRVGQPCTESKDHDLNGIHSRSRSSSCGRLFNPQWPVVY